MKLALIQMRVEPGEIQTNLARAEKLTREAAKRGADIVLLPEALPFGWMDPSARTSAEEIPNGNYCARFAALASELQIHLCGGLVEKNGEKTFNAAVLLSPTGELLLHHRKIHELGIAHPCYALGDKLGVIDSSLGRIGLMICADGFAPGQAITRILALMGGQIILSPCAWAVPADYDNVATPYGKLWIDNYRPIARDYGLWIAGCSNVGPIHTGPWAGRKCIGCSLVIGPDGEIKAHGSYGENAEEILFVSVSLTAQTRCDAGHS
jgi:predicted amidohydrolase